jgi:hypothetical protein
MRHFLLTAATFGLLTACSDQNDVAEDKIEKAAETSATVAGPLPAALGLSEAQLIDADLIGPDGNELGEVVQVLRDREDKVDRLLVELDGVGDRYVHVPILGLKPVVNGDDTNLQTTLTRARLDALPEVKLTPP